jgi:3-dehydroquinate dehydratase
MEVVRRVHVSMLRQRRWRGRKTWRNRKSTEYVGDKADSGVFGFGESGYKAALVFGFDHWVHHRWT